MGILITIATIVVVGLIIFLIAFIATRDGNAVESENEQEIENIEEEYEKKTSANYNEGELVATTGLKVLCFFVPIVGLSIYSNNISFNRKFANDCGKWSLISFLICTGLSVITMIILMIMEANF